MANVLVVDDSEDIISWLSFELNEAGHTVSAAYNGEQAYQVLERSRPDIVLLDVDMPVMNGFQLLRKMRGKPEMQEMHVLMLTGRGRDSDWTQGYKLGVHDYLTKPLGANEVLEAIDATLQRSPEQIAERCAEELDRSELLTKLEAMFEEDAPALPDSYLETPVLPEPEPEPVVEAPVVQKRGFFARLFRRSERAGMRSVTA